MTDPKLAASSHECPSCHRPMLPVAGTMFYRGRYFAGLVCWPCNALHDNPDDSMIAYAKSVYSLLPR